MTGKAVETIKGKLRRKALLHSMWYEKTERMSKKTNEEYYV